MKVKRFLQALAVVALAGALYTGAYVSTWYQNHKSDYVHAIYLTTQCIASAVNGTFDNVDTTRIPSVYIDNHEYMEDVLDPQVAYNIIPMVGMSYLETDTTEDIHYVFEEREDGHLIFTSDVIVLDIYLDESSNKWQMNVETPMGG